MLPKSIYRVLKRINLISSYHLGVLDDTPRVAAETYIWKIGKIGENTRYLLIKHTAWILHMGQQRLDVE